MSAEPVNDAQLTADDDEHVAAYTADPRFHEIIALRQKSYYTYSHAVTLQGLADEARERGLPHREFQELADVYEQQADELGELSNEIYDLIHAELNLDDGWGGLRSAAQSPSVTEQQIADRLRIAREAGHDLPERDGLEQVAAATPALVRHYHELGVGADLANRAATITALTDAMPESERSAAVGDASIDAHHEPARAPAALADDRDPWRPAAAEPAVADIEPDAARNMALADEIFNHFAGTRAAEAEPGALEVETLWATRRAAIDHAHQQVGNALDRYHQALANGADRDTALDQLAEDNNAIEQPFPDAWARDDIEPDTTLEPTEAPAQHAAPEAHHSADGAPDIEPEMPEPQRPEMEADRSLAAAPEPEPPPHRAPEPRQEPDRETDRVAAAVTRADEAMARADAALREPEPAPATELPAPSWNHRSSRPGTTNWEGHKRHGNRHEDHEPVEGRRVVATRPAGRPVRGGSHSPRAV